MIMIIIMIMIPDMKDVNVARYIYMSCYVEHIVEQTRAFSQQ